MKVLYFEFYNSFTDESMGSVRLIFDRTKSMTGYYSKLWKLFRCQLAHQFSIDIRFVRAKIDKL